MCTCSHTHNSSRTPSGRLTKNAARTVRPLKADPTRTLSLRNRFRQQMRARFAKLARSVRDLVDSQDVFGIRDTKPLRFDYLQSRPVLNIAPRGWEFKKDADKIQSFRDWLQAEVGSQILGGESNPVWTHEYIDSAYRQGAVRAYTDTHRLGAVDANDYYQGSQDQFLKSAFAAPETRAKLEAIYTRTYSSLAGITSTMDSQMSRILSQGLLDGSNPRDIAKLMTDTIGKLSRTRAETVARTEIIFAHAEGQLDSFQKLGIAELGIMAEWSTAGDDRVCPECSAMAGSVYKTEDAHGLIPFHPNCRCTWIPSMQKAPEEKVTAGKVIEKKVTEEKEGFSPGPLLNLDAMSEQQQKEVLTALRKEKIKIGGPDPKPHKQQIEALKDFQNTWKMSPTDFKKQFVKGLPEELSDGILDITRGHNDMWSVSFDSLGASMKIRRTVDMGSKTVSNDLFEVARSFQKSGVGKTALRNQTEIWEHVGMERMTVHANIDVGGYAWARYGYVPDADDWMDLKEAMMEEFLEIKDKITNKGMVEMVIEVLEKSRNPEDIRFIAGLKTDVGGEPLGKYLLLGSDWSGVLDLKNPKTHRIFKSYISPGP